MTGKPTSASRLTLSQIMDDHDTNLMGTVHGGVLMKLVDSLAGVVSARHSEGASVTASVDEMVFRVPVRVGDVLHLHAQVNWAGSTSMEIGVRATADRWDSSVPPVHVASAYLVLVAVDDHGRPRPVPPVVPETAEDRRRYAEAGIRRTHRLARRAAITASRTVA
ncbi:acyl-CoA thioesterase [Amycolatopsis tolypomycina]|uniref:Acyl-CoA hydrolase n=1 Tax=Amycolatopsis tolypomycina TaxID=208445 RepID=A0A1H4YYL9_9PSEU|nr:hotdog domain-containing protein [Amycolatopsis tolypomycina]SED22130.1 Acyl-CoA hydrolase [Amycolatopsis tolypomycina]